MTWAEVIAIFVLGVAVGGLAVIALGIGLLVVAFRHDDPDARSRQHDDGRSFAA